MVKPKLAVGYGGICGGCDVSLINAISERLAELLEACDIIYWPIAVDSKNRDVEAADSIDISIYMGMVRTDEHLRLVKLLREKSKLMVLYGACAIYGGIPGLGIIYEPHQLMEIVNSTVTTEKNENRIEGFELPSLLTANEVVSAYFMKIAKPNIVVPGCPPSDELNSRLLHIIFKYVDEKTVPEGTIILADNESLCRNCPRKPREPDKIVMSRIYRLSDTALEEGKCFLEQGIICMGPATRAGCEYSCIKNNLPCVGCMGPAPGVSDFGLKMLSSIASIALIDKEKILLEKGLAKELDKIIDPLGTFYRYTLPSSSIARFLLRKNR
ncbi:MAG: hypothetical protein QXF34_02315 [Desulfurococcaceae archaeon]